jgi:hypothetical protein
MIRIVASTRTQSGPVEVKAWARNSASALIEATALRSLEVKRFRTSIDSDAQLWIEVDGRRVEVTDIESATSAAKARAEAKIILAS